MDSHGRIFYIDHKNHTTTWQKPCPTDQSTGDGADSDTTNAGGSAAAASDPSAPSAQERQRLDQRYGDDGSRIKNVSREVPPFSRTVTSASTAPSRRRPCPPRPTWTPTPAWPPPRPPPLSPSTGREKSCYRGRSSGSCADLILSSGCSSWNTRRRTCSTDLPSSTCSPGSGARKNTWLYQFANR